MTEAELNNWIERHKSKVTQSDLKYYFVVEEKDLRTLFKDQVLVPKAWTPTSENINNLPEPVRKYIMQLETLCDPAGLVAKIALLTDRTDALVQTILELQTELRNRD